MNVKVLVIRANIGLIIFSVLWSSIVFSDTVNIVSPYSIPPYVIQQSNNGIQLEIVKESLLNVGYTTKISYASNKRSLNLLQTKYVEGMINVPHKIPGIFYSEPVVKYQNGVFYLNNRNFNIETVSDLSKLRVVAFQNASKYFGPEYLDMVINNTRYDEVVDQLSQLQMLFNHRCDVIVMDKRIFTYFWSLHKKEEGFDASVVFADIISPTPRLVAFNSENMRDDFNAGLAKLKASGRYQKIIDSYVNDDLWKK